MQDQQLTCRDCAQGFAWTAGEQSFYAQKGLSAPTRCKDCRAKKKADRANAGSGSTGPREMFPITCASCGKQAEVPFQPTRSDVLCRDCFTAQRNGGAQPSADASTNSDAADNSAPQGDE
jgi:CxxC-x17-CxxC domain-containing protein